MGYLVIGDIHFGKRLQTAGFLDYQIIQFLKIIDYCVEHGIKNIIQLGDWFDNRTNVDFELLSRIENEILKVLEKHNITIYYCAGNHDLYYKENNKICSVDVISEKFGQIIIVKDEPEEHIIDGEKVLLVPWISRSNYDICIDAIKSSDAKRCFGHFEINGFVMTGTHVCNYGLTQSSFKHFDEVYSGHFHKKGRIKNITYVGSYCQLDWGDYKDLKQVVKIDSNNSKQVELTRELFKKIILPDENLDVSQFKNSVIKIYLNDKLDKKQSKVLDTLIENAMIYEVIDNTLILDTDANIDIEKEEFEDIFKDYMEELDDISYEDKLAINDIVTMIHKEARGMI